MSRYMGGQTTAVAERSGLTNDEIEELSEAFKLFDTEGTGYIDAGELKAAMESLGYKSKNRMVYNMIESMPQGSLNFAQFLSLMTARISDTDSREDLAKVFRLFTNDGQYITVDNLQAVARELGEPMSQAELREMVERADANGDNRIDFEEFYAIMTNKSYE